MKKTIMMSIALAVGLLFTSCKDYETYGDKKEKEYNAIMSYIAREGINRIDESVFHAQDNTTDTTRNEYVYLQNSGVYMQIVRKGCGTPLKDGENASLKIRFLELSIFDTAQVVTNFYDPYDPDFMNISRTGNEFTASFTSGLMNSWYGASVPAGWLVPFNYIKLDGPTATDDIAKVRLIVPHSQGHSIASSNVYPYFYEITFQR